MSYKNAGTKIKNRLDYLSNDNMIVNIKDFYYSLLEINKLSFQGVVSLNIYYIKCITTKIPNRVSIDRTDNDENFLYLLLDSVDGSIDKNNRIKYIVFTPTEKNKEAPNITKKFGKKLKEKLK